MSARLGRLMVALLAAAWLTGPGPAPAQVDTGAIDQRSLIMPPAYPAPPAGIITLPAPQPPVVPREPGSTDRPTYVPGRTDTRVGIGPDGRIIHYQVETPSRFLR